MKTVPWAGERKLVATTEAVGLQENKLELFLYIIGQPENQARPSFQARKIYTTKKDPRPIFYVLGQLSKNSAGNTKTYSRVE